MIERLQITALRNISRADLRLAKCNVFVGDNGSGKTSLLEAIFLLSRGKSFRHHQPKRYIQHHQPATIVHAALTDSVTLAVQKQLDATTTLRLNQTTVYSQSPLTQQLPTLLIDPSSMDMLEQGSASRRQILDWLAFHMKPSFHPQWLAYQRLLKQRNRLLKQSRQLTPRQQQELYAWDKGIASHAALIHYYRQQVFEAWQPYFESCVIKLLPKYSGKLALSYVPGYDVKLSLDEQLQARLNQDLQQGYTRIGSHRADIQVYWRSHSPDSSATSMIKEQAANVLSRGEKKLLITALKLSQLPLLLAKDDKLVSDHSLGPGSAGHPQVAKSARVSDQPEGLTPQSQTGDMTGPLAYQGPPSPVVLLDDLSAELDAQAIKVLLSELSALSCQVFITSLTLKLLPIVQHYWPNSHLFHVKQGQITLTDIDDFSG